MPTTYTYRQKVPCAPIKDADCICTTCGCTGLLPSSFSIAGTEVSFTFVNPLTADEQTLLDNQMAMRGYESGSSNTLKKNGVSDTFTTEDGKTVTVVDGQITAIV